ncbi:MAG: 16S rRNA (cytosine(967)-C(5))-methyltransferase RsmB [Pyrinomonadaceae bacterium]
MKISPARRAAFEILNRIDIDRAFSSVLLPHYESTLSPSDRGLCHELVLGVLRRRIYLDAIIGKLAGQKKLDTVVRNAVRLGAYQITSLNKIPTYSAINESVNLVQIAKKTSAKGFVNAILRRISETVPSLEFSDEIERVSIQSSHPKWLVEKWVSDFGFVEAEKICVANNDVPTISFREVWKRNPALAGYRKGELLGDTYVATSIDKELRDMSDAGEIYFQDEASQLVASVAVGSPGGRFLDVCAAPGGKTAQIAIKYSGIDRAVVIAGDLHESRVRLLRSTCERQKVDRVNIVRYDAQVPLPFASESFDTVLVDAPCSGTGTFRHNPEIRYFLRPDDFGELAKKQLTILRNASYLVRPGGRLIYSTCSIQMEENERVCENFLEASNAFQLTRPDVPERILTGSGFARTFPHRDGTDGFFLAQFERF